MREQKIIGVLSGESEILGVISSPQILKVKSPDYEGEYVVTPGEETITLATADHNLGADVIVNPIPPNYGRIAQVGSKLLVW